MTNMTPANSARSISLKLAVAARQMRHRFDERVNEMGGTRAKWLLIATVAAHPGATQRTIATLLEVTDVTAGRLIDRICAEGLLERRENPQDRRAYCVYLTPAAQPVLEKLATAAELFETEVFAGFSAEELTNLDRLLDKLARNLGSSRPELREKRVATGG
jgi:MarR family transcriptional regulator, transcriptional regulator for hemolysin